MFGYININQNELSEEDRKVYQSYYCGLCRKLKANCGIKGQMQLAYDMTFVVVLLTGLYELPHEESTFSCAIHPTKKQVAWINEATNYAADMNLILSYYNLLDDWKDEHNLPKKTLAGMLKSDYERIAKRYPRQIQAADKYLKDLELAEKREETNIDVVAGLTGEFLGEIFEWKADEWAEELRCLGFYMGKFIYLMDAYEDLEKDIKHGQYNPFRALQKEKGAEEFETISRLLLTSMVAECAKSFERLPILMHADILRNVLYSGIWSRYDLIQHKKQKKEKKAKDIATKEKKR